MRNMDKVKEDMKRTFPEMFVKKEEERHLSETVDKKYLSF